MNETGPVRREGFLDAGTAAALAADPDRVDLAPILAAVTEFYGPLGSAVVRPLVLGPGDSVADLIPKGAPAGFLLDLGPPHWRSEWGGLLLFRGAGDRVHGYRPVPGALTLFNAAARPMISLIAPQGAQRTSVMGWWL